MYAGNCNAIKPSEVVMVPRNSYYKKKPFKVTNICYTHDARGHTDRIYSITALEQKEIVRYFIVRLYGR